MSVRRTLQPEVGSKAAVKSAANHLRAGRLVAFPTETVYGLGADARNGEAVARIFAAKGRPSLNPLIVHTANTASARHYARLGSLAERLAAAFWPGGLTLVLEKQPDSGLSDLVSAGLPSVAVRVPSHPVAKALLLAADCPVAAPSANRSGHISPTKAQHVADDLDDPHLAMILDDGPCSAGIESTIIDARGECPVVLRHGAVPIEDVAEAAGAAVQEAVPRGSVDTTAQLAPGQLASHYAPAKPVLLNVLQPTSGQALLAFGAPPPGFDGPLYNLSPAENLIEAAANLFEGLRQLDDTEANAIAAMPIPMANLGRAINDRLHRAAAPRPVIRDCPK